MFKKTFRIAAGLALAFGMLVPVARAGVRDQATRLTFDQSVEIPGQVLQAGSYWFVLVDDLSSRNIVNVFDDDRTILLGTVMTVSAERSDLNDNTELRLVEQPKDQLKLVGWFYPGNSGGHEFVYDWSGTKRYSPEDVFTVIAQPSTGERLFAQQ